SATTDLSTLSLHDALPISRGELARHLGGLLLVERLLGLLDQGEDVTHVEDPGGHPVGVEGVEVLDLLAGGGEHDRAAGDVADRRSEEHTSELQSRENLVCR